MKFKVCTITLLVWLLVSTQHSIGQDKKWEFSWTVQLGQSASYLQFDPAEDRVMDTFYYATGVPRPGYYVIYDSATYNNFRIPSLDFGATAFYGPARAGVFYNRFDGNPNIGFTIGYDLIRLRWLHLSANVGTGYFYQKTPVYRYATQQVQYNVNWKPSIYDVYEPHLYMEYFSEDEKMTQRIADLRAEFQIGDRSSLVAAFRYIFIKNTGQFREPNRRIYQPSLSYAYRFGNRVNYPNLKERGQRNRDSVFAVGLYAGGGVNYNASPYAIRYRELERWYWRNPIVPDMFNSAYYSPNKFTISPQFGVNLNNRYYFEYGFTYQQQNDTAVIEDKSDYDVTYLDYYKRSQHDVTVYRRVNRAKSDHAILVGLNYNVGHMRFNTVYTNVYSGQQHTVQNRGTNDVEFLANFQTISGMATYRYTRGRMSYSVFVRQPIYADVKAETANTYGYTQVTFPNMLSYEERTDRETATTSRFFKHKYQILTEVGVRVAFNLEVLRKER